MVYLTHCKKAFRNTNYEDIVQWESVCKILHLLHLLCYVIVVPSQAQWFTSTSGIIKFECLGYYRRQRMRYSTLSVFLFLWWRAPINVSIEVQKAERTDLLYHALHGSQMPKVKCNQWARLFHSFPWLRQKLRVNPSLLLTGSLPVREAECQGEKETPGGGWERMRSKGTQYI